ncbi:MAG: hypothetical protein WD733_04115 [Bryobacterales bacterium]
MEDLAPVLMIGFILAFIGYRQWLREQRRRMIHRERIAAIEKGVEPPPYPEDPPRQRSNTRRVLLLSGLIWLAVGITSMIAGSIILPDPVVRAMQDAPPPTMYWLGLVPAAVGLAHLIVYAKNP